MSDDPNAPDYQPTHDPGSPSAGAGSGADFGADLHQLYDLGRVRLPQIAEVFAAASDALWATAPAVQGFAGRLGNPVGLATLLEIQTDLNHAAYQGSQRSSAGGRGIVAMVDDFVRTDEEALAEFERLTNLPEYSGRYDEPTPPAPTPRHPEDARTHPLPDGVY